MFGLFNNIQDLPKPTENIVHTHDWRGFFANLGQKMGETYRKFIGDK
jgi:hypothetical protein